MPGAPDLDALLTQWRNEGGDQYDPRHPGRIGRVGCDSGARRQCHAMAQRGARICRGNRLPKPQQSEQCKEEEGKIGEDAVLEFPEEWVQPHHEHEQLGVRRGEHVAHEQRKEQQRPDEYADGELLELERVAQRIAHAYHEDQAHAGE